MAAPATHPPDHVSVVTGASAGIGLETARGLANAGGSVVLVGRNPERTLAIAHQLRASTGNEQVRALLADFSSLSDVRSLADRLLDSCPRIDVLVNNAGVWHPDRKVSRDGLEDTFAVNHLAPFLLTQLLCERIAAGGGRIVAVSSRLQIKADLRLDDLLWEQRRYRGLGAYAASKLANVLFAFELSRRMEGTGVTSNAVHPGDVATRVVRDSALLSFGLELVRPALLTPREGAQTSLHVATAQELEGHTGRYYAACDEARASPTALDKDLASALWEASAALVDSVR